MKKKILIASPVHQKPTILKEFLHGLEQLKKDDLHIHYYFVDDNQDEASSELLQAFQQKNDNVILKKNVERAVYNPDFHHWQDEVIEKVAKNKDKMLDHARHFDFDYIFFIDSDLVLHPQTLIHLVGVDKEIVSEVFYTSWAEGTVEMPQVWVSDEYEFTDQKGLTEDEKTQAYLDFMAMLGQPGVYEVGGLGACTLISKSALEAGVSFDRIYNVSFWGEDRHFCIRAVALGIQLYASTYYPPLHLYRDSDLEKVDAFWESAEIEKI